MTATTINVPCGCQYAPVVIQLHGTTSATAKVQTCEKHGGEK